MTVSQRELCFDESKVIISQSKNLWRDRSVCCSVYSERAMFSTMIKKEVHQFLVSTIALLEDRTVCFKTFKKEFEDGIQRLNERLELWSGTRVNWWFIALHGAIQIFFDDQYACVLLWSVSLAIVRNNMLHYLSCNNNENAKRISLFSQLIEWWIQEEDDYLILGNDISTFCSKNTMNTLIWVNSSRDKPLIEELWEYVKHTLVCNNVQFVSSCIVWMGWMFSRCRE